MIKEVYSRRGKLERWTQIKDIETEGEDAYEYFNDVFYRGGFAEATEWCVRKGFRTFTLMEAHVVDETRGI